MQDATPQDLELIAAQIIQCVSDGVMSAQTRDQVLSLINEAIAARDNSPVGGAKPKWVMRPLSEVLQLNIQHFNIPSMPGQQPVIQGQLMLPPMWVISDMMGNYQFADQHHMALWHYARSLEYGAAEAKRAEQRARRERDEAVEKHERIKSLLHQVNMATMKLEWTKREPVDAGNDDAGNDDERITVMITATNAEIDALRELRARTYWLD